MTVHSEFREKMMHKEGKEQHGKKIDWSKISGYVSVGIFVISVLFLLCLLVMSVMAAGALAEWAAAAGFGIVLVNIWSILLARWGLRQTGRKLRVNRTAVWLNAGLIALMAVIYVLGVV